MVTIKVGRASQKIEEEYDRKIGEMKYSYYYY